MIPLRPSSAAIWTKCAASPRIAATVPDEEPSDPAREGTCAAWLAEMVVTGQAPNAASLIGTLHPENGWVVDPSMAHYIQAYVDMLRSRGGTVDVERKVRLNEMIEGTPDSFGVVAGDTLYVDDLKYGFDIVEATTPQVVIYAGAIFRLLSRKGVNIRRVHLGIYQPRAYHPSGIHRTRPLWPEELMREVQEIERAGEAAQRDDAMATPGKHCRYARCAVKCSAVAHQLYDAVHKMHHAQQRHMTREELAAELSFLDMAEAMFKGRRDAVHAEAEARIQRGENIVGWVRESGYGQRRWTAPEAVVRMLTGVEPTEPKMVTPLELERRGADPEIVAALTETPRTKAKLKPVKEGYYASKFTA